MIAIAALIVLAATIYPSLMPFKDYLDKNPGMGSLGLIFWWPLVVAQGVIGFLPLENLFRKKVLLSWIMLLIILVLALYIDRTTLGIIYK